MHVLISMVLNLMPASNEAKTSIKQSIKFSPHIKIIMFIMRMNLGTGLRHGC